MDLTYGSDQEAAEVRRRRRTGSRETAHNLSSLSGGARERMEPRRPNSVSIDSSTGPYCWSPRPRASPRCRASTAVRWARSPYSWRWCCSSRARTSPTCFGSPILGDARFTGGIVYRRRPVLMTMFPWVTSGSSTKGGRSTTATETAPVCGASSIGVGDAQVESIGAARRPRRCFEFLWFFPLLRCGEPRLLDRDAPRSDGRRRQSRRVEDQCETVRRHRGREGHSRHG